MSISFNDVPNDRLVPLVYAEFDNTRAVQGAGVQSYKALLVGNMLSAGSADPLVPTRVSNKDKVAELFGEGSLLADMARAYFENNKSTEVWAVGVDDESGSAAASGSFAFSGTATESGTAYAYIGGYRVKVPVTAGDTAATVATAFQTALAEAENSHLPVNNSKSGGTVTVWMKNKGAFSNDLDLRVNYFEGESLPAGLAVVVTQPSGGTTNPDIQDVIDVLGDTQYNVIIMPWNDASNTTALRDELIDRWGPIRQNDGVGIIAKTAAFAALTTFGDTLNTPHLVCMGSYKSPTPTWKLAAITGAVVAYYGPIDPARPFQTLQMQDAMGPSVVERFTSEERNQILQAGVSTYNVGPDGIVRMERLVTTYKTNSLGAPDISYRDLNTVLTLSYIRYDYRNMILTKYPRHKLADDGGRYSEGQAIVTPKIMRGETILRFKEWEQLGLVEGLEQFKNDLIVERNIQDPNRLDIRLPTDLVNQLVIAGVQIQFIL